MAGPQLPIERTRHSSAVQACKEKGACAVRTPPQEDPGDHLLSRVSNIIGRTCLTTVFGMGTGMAKPLSSPGMLGESSERLHVKGRGELLEHGDSTILRRTREP
jgi:hypothetical protein